MTGPSDRLMQLAFFAIDHGVDSVKAGGPLVPFLVVQSGGERQLHRYLADSQEAGLSAARAAADALGSMADAYAISYDGFLTVGEARFDAIFAEVGERGADQAHLFAQRYRPKGLLRGLKAIGNVAHIGSAVCRLRSTV